MLEKTERLVQKASECISKQAEREIQGHLRGLQEKNMRLERELGEWKIEVETSKSRHTMEKKGLESEVL